MIVYFFFFFFSSRRRHTRLTCDWSSDVCSSDLRPALLSQKPVADALQPTPPQGHARARRTVCERSPSLITGLGGAAARGSLPPMPGDELAAELLTSVLDADPLAGSLYGISGYDSNLPDFSRESQSGHARKLASIAERAEQAPDAGLEETELQTLDFVRCLARGMADAAAVPIIEFTISDTFAAPVGEILSSLPKIPLDTEERREGYLTRLRGLPGMLETVAQRHQEGARAGRTAVARLVEAAITQLDLMIQDPTAGAIVRTGADADFSEAVAVAVDDHARPALAGYRDALQTSVLPTARDDEHPGICFLPDGEAMYEAVARHHTSMRHSAEELHAMGRQIVEEVLEELVETGSRLFGTTDVTEIFTHLSDPSLRYRSREEMLEHAQRVVAAAEAEAPKWFATVPDVACA